ncbi:HDOD domain-containing protein [Pelagicoccus albus]|uniref:HDOD domain-containing protein n=1 Tax=Pelagicoccus albus TaxID=415222 RepID=A0A7X1EA66_9BACT|nr:HDOD domain-containing protein [Pelagicoccus albus]MBC2606472.1 HDOD domain-containing protein [Pelagicoccus albus]
MTTRILIIDPCEDTLKYYREVLEPKSSQWTLDCTGDSTEGIELAKRNTPDVVIVALSIDDDHGPDLLRSLDKIAPDAQPFISATETEKTKLESTLGSKFHFLPNPCHADKLITEINRCIAIETWLGNPRIKELISKMGEFPSLPSIYLKVVSALNSKNASAELIADCISGDLAISAKVLQTVNSSYYGFDQKVSNISEAVSILGLESVKNLVLGIEVFNKLGRSRHHKAITDQLWHHSMSVATAARRISQFETNDSDMAEEAYTAGLMHDIGKLVHLNAEPEKFQDAIKMANEESIPLHEAEEELLGCTHAETGAYILARWSMPTNLTEAVALHHQPVNSFGKSFSALAAVHVANAIVHHRQNAEHPSSTPNEEFIIEIGKSDSWQDWVDTSTGKTSKKPQVKEAKEVEAKEPTQEPASPKLAVKKSEPTSEPSPAPAASTQSEPKVEEKQNKKSLMPLVALAACIALAATGITLMNTVPTEEPSESLSLAEEAPTSSLASAIEQAKEMSGITETEEALQEIFDDQELAATPEPAEEELLVHEEADASDLVAEKEENELPKPKLPEPEPEQVFPEVVLGGIFYSEKRPLASVNGKIVKTGDTISGVKIVRIEKARVTVQYESEQRSYKLN